MYTASVSLFIYCLNRCSLQNFDKERVHMQLILHNPTVSFLSTQVQLSHLSAELMIAFHINIVQLHMCSGNSLELLMIDKYLTGVHALQPLRWLLRAKKIFTLLPMSTNDLQNTEEIPLIKHQGHQFVLCVPLLLGHAWIIFNLCSVITVQWTDLCFPVFFLFIQLNNLSLFV